MDRLCRSRGGGQAPSQMTAWRSTPSRSPAGCLHAAEEQPAVAVPLEDELVLIALVGADRAAQRVGDREAGVDQGVDGGAAAGLQRRALLAHVDVAHRVADVA